MTGATIIARLMDKVEIGCFYGCWIWIGATTGGNRSWDWGGVYGAIKVKGKKVGAHRVSYEEFHGAAIPAGHSIHHICETRLCINPLHLRSVSVKTNTRISNGKHLDDALEEARLEEPIF